MDNLILGSLIQNLLQHHKITIKYININLFSLQITF